MRQLKILDDVDKVNAWLRRHAKDAMIERITPIAITDGVIWFVVEYRV